MTIAALIDKVDTFEQVRDQLAGILVTEVASQKVLAAAASQDPNDWDLSVYTERSNPWETFLSPDTIDPQPAPIVNIWYENSSFPKSGGNVVARQQAVGRYNIDCYAYAVSQDDGGSGHLPGDQQAALRVHKAVRLVRNILMAGEYKALGLRGLVSQRWIESITIFQPQQNDVAVEQVVAARLALEVGFNEFAPQVVGDELCEVAIDITRASDGLITAEADFIYT